VLSGGEAQCRSGQRGDHFANTLSIGCGHFFGGSEDVIVDIEGGSHRSSRLIHYGSMIMRTCLRARKSTKPR